MRSSRDHKRKSSITRVSGAGLLRVSTRGCIAGWGRVMKWSFFQVLKMLAVCFIFMDVSRLFLMKTVRRGENERIEQYYPRTGLQQPSSRFENFSSRFHFHKE